MVMAFFISANRREKRMPIPPYTLPFVAGAGKGGGVMGHGTLAESSECCGIFPQRGMGGSVVGDEEMIMIYG